MRAYFGSVACPRVERLDGCGRSEDRGVCVESASKLQADRSAI